MRPVQGLPHAVHGNVGRLVAAVPDLAREEVAHGPEGALGERGAQRDGGDQLEHLLPVLGQRRRGDLRVVRVAVGIDAAAHAVGRLHDLLPSQLVGPAHHQELEEVGDARGGGRLRARPHLDHDREGDDGRDRVLAYEQSQAVGQLGPRHAVRLGRRDGRDQERQQEGNAQDH